MQNIIDNGFNSINADFEKRKMSSFWNKIKLRQRRKINSSLSAQLLADHYQSGRSPKVVALFSATNFSSYIIELFQLHDTIQIKYNYAWIHYNIAIRSHLMI